MEIESYMGYLIILVDKGSHRNLWTQLIRTGNAAYKYFL